MRFNGQYRVVDELDRNEVLRVFDGPFAAELAMAFSRHDRCEIQRAEEAADGSIFEWVRTALAETRVRGR